LHICWLTPFRHVSDDGGVGGGGGGGDYDDYDDDDDDDDDDMAILKEILDTK